MKTHAEQQGNQSQGTVPRPEKAKKCGIEYIQAGGRFKKSRPFFDVVRKRKTGIIGSLSSTKIKNG
jgi:hypothetical protein